MKKYSYKPKNSNWDTLNSTFVLRTNFENGKFICGYSKNECAEKSDKADVLGNFIIRLLDRGYLDFRNKSVDPITCIEVFEHSTRGKKLVKLYYKFFEIVAVDFVEDEYYAGMLKFLTEFYSMIKAGKTPYEIRKKLYESGPGINPDDELNYSKRRFIDFDSLNKFSYNLYMRKNFPREQVVHFMVRYCEIHFGYTPKVNFN